jgi:Plasmid pRiA4b ORF-3-like protein
VLVPASIKLPRLNQTIQLAMGWGGGHLHEFVIADVHYGRVDPDFPYDPPLESETRVTLRSALAGFKTFRYVYDFGDD